MEVPKYNKNKLIAPANPECVPVPVAWLEKLCEMKAKYVVSSSDSNMDKLLGYVSSAEAFIIKKK